MATTGSPIHTMRESPARSPSGSHHEREDGRYSREGRTIGGSVHASAALPATATASTPKAPSSAKKRRVHARPWWSSTQPPNIRRSGKSIQSHCALRLTVASQTTTNAIAAQYTSAITHAARTLQGIRLVSSPVRISPFVDVISNLSPLPSQPRAAD